MLNHIESREKGSVPIIVGVLVLLILFAGAGYYFGTRMPSDNSDSTRISPDPKISSIPSPSPVETKLKVEPDSKKIVFIEPPVRDVNNNIRSYDGKYTFELANIPEQNPELCEYILTDTTAGRKRIILKSIGEKIYCSIGMGATTPFLGFGSNDRMALGVKKGEIAILDIKTDTHKPYTYDPTYTFNQVDSSLENWIFTLYKPNVQTNSTYVLNKDGKIIKEFSYATDDQKDYSIASTLYDDVNNGFVFISRTYRGESGSYKIEFIPTSNLQARTLLITDFVPVPGRGCNPNSIASTTKGEVIINPSCMSVNPKYLSADQYIHLKL